MDVLIAVAIIAALVIANGLFVAAEFAIVGAPRTSIEHQASQGNVLAQRVRRVLDDPRRTDRYIATTQIGISVASLGLGMYGEHQLAEWFAQALQPYDESPWIAAHAMASVIAIGLLTYLHIVLGEMVPKALALQRADRTVLYVTPPILLMQAAVLPLVVALNGIGNGLLKLFGIRRSDEGAERYHTTEELQFIIEESREGGLLRGESGRILRELFEFGDLSAGEVMVPRVLLVGIPVDTEADELRAIVRAHPHTRYPVYSGDLDNIVGSLHIKDLLGHLVSRRPVTARDARPLPHVPAAALLDEVLAAMRRFRAQMAVVMDEHGGTAGLVTIEDLFEEVVGEIEEGRGRTPIAKDSHGRLHVRGTVRLEEAGEALGCTLEHTDVSTVSGLVLTLLGRPAQPGDVVTHHNVQIQVMAVAGRGVQDAVISIATRNAPARTDRQGPPAESRA
jgi:CBS domain containing-hemolysin-like protein